MAKLRLLLIILLISGCRNAADNRKMYTHPPREYYWIVDHWLEKEQEFQSFDAAYDHAKDQSERTGRVYSIKKYWRKRGR